MKSLLLCLFFSTTLLSATYALEPVKVADGIYCYFGLPEVMDERNNGNMVNSCFVDMGRVWLVVDSGPTYLYAKEALSKIEAIKKMPVATVIDTHVHDDHWLGNGFYLSQGAEVFGPSAFKKEVDPSAVTRMERRVSKEAYMQTSPKLPTTFVDQNRTLHIDGNEVRLIKVARKAHTSGDILVYLPKMQTLFGGDVIFNDRLPSLRDGDINGWIATLEMIKAMPLNNIIGGHGEAVGKDAADLTYRYLLQLRSEVKAAIDNGIGIDDAVRTIRMPSFSSVALYDEMQAKNVEAAYRTLEWSDE
jgi:cyclase